MKWEFATTSWSQVLAARDGPTTASRQALEALCNAYWYPLYAFVRLQGYDPEQSLDLTQAYFTELLAKDYLKDVDPSLGRFRSFLKVSLKHFLSKERDKAQALKRGGQAKVISLDGEDAENRYRFEPVDRLTPEDVFERRWALTTIERVLGKLRKEFSELGKEEEFQSLKGYLTGEEPKIPYQNAAEELGITEGAVKASVHRLRQRFGRQLRQEIAETVADPQEVDDEVRHLLQVITPFQAGPA
jgi:RNA polymerase sigma-70 factor (ECF subfamily)